MTHHSKTLEEVHGWIVYKTFLDTCPFCSSENKNDHRPFCAFDERTHVFSSEKLNSNMNEWMHGFQDGLQHTRTRKTPAYLHGNRAGREKQNLKWLTVGRLSRS